MTLKTLTNQLTLSLGPYGVGPIELHALAQSPKSFPGELGLLYCLRTHFNSF